MTLNQEAQSHALPRSGSRLSAEPLHIRQGVKDYTSAATTELKGDTVLKGEQIGEQGGQRCI